MNTASINSQILPQSQPFEYGSLFNPAFAGSESQGKIFAINRLQWPELNNSLLGVGIGAELPLAILHGGVGFNIFRETEGQAFRRTRIDMIYAWDASLSRDLSVSAALRVSWQSFSWNADGLLLPDMIEQGSLRQLPADESLAGERYGYPDFAAGVIGAWKNIYFGSSVNHLSRPYIHPDYPSLGCIPMAWNAHAGINITGNRRLISQEAIRFSPSIIVACNGYNYSFSGGSYFIVKPLYAGIWMRVNNEFSHNSLICLLGLSRDKVRVAFSYDMDLISSSNLPSGGSYELSASLRFDPPAKRKRIKAIKCPKI